MITINKKYKYWTQSIFSNHWFQTLKAIQSTLAYSKIQLWGEEGIVYFIFFISECFPRFVYFVSHLERTLFQLVHIFLSPPMSYFIHVQNEWNFYLLFFPEIKKWLHYDFVNFNKWHSLPLVIYYQGNLNLAFFSFFRIKRKFKMKLLMVLSLILCSTKLISSHPFGYSSKFGFFGKFGKFLNLLQCLELVISSLR